MDASKDQIRLNLLLIKFAVANFVFLDKNNTCKYKSLTVASNKLLLSRNKIQGKYHYEIECFERLEIE